MDLIYEWMMGIIECANGFVEGMNSKKIDW